MTTVRPNPVSVPPEQRVRIFPWVLLACWSLATGCTTPPSTEPPGAAQTAAPNASVFDSTEPLPVRQLKKNMPADRVSALLGAPGAIKPNSRPDVISDIWVYTRTISGPTRQVTAEMREVPFIDPLTGRMRSIQEPIYKTERTYFTETTELLMVNGLLTEWKQSLSADHTEYH